MNRSFYNNYLSSLHDGTVVVVGPENGMNGADFFLSGDQIAPTSFFSTGYQAQFHTANGIETTSGQDYAPQMAPEVVALFENDHAVILDGIMVGDPSLFKILCDELGNYIETGADHSALFYFDNTAAIDTIPLGITSPPPNGRYRLAFLRNNGNVWVSVNGNPVATGSADSLPRDLTTIVLSVREGASVSEFIILTGGSLPNSTDLPSLSTLS